MKPHPQPHLFLLTKTHTHGSLSHYFLFCTALMKTTVCSRNVTYNYIFLLEYWTFACEDFSGWAHITSSQSDLLKLGLARPTQTFQ